jgi:hypothetical protein
MDENIEQTKKPVPPTVQVSELTNQELMDLKLKLEIRMNIIIKELRKRIQT